MEFYKSRVGCLQNPALTVADTSSLAETHFLRYDVAPQRCVDILGCAAKVQRNLYVHKFLT